MALMQSQGGAAVSAAPTKQAVVLPQNARNPQKLLVEKGLPQIARIYTDLGGYGILPYPRSH